MQTYKNNLSFVQYPNPMKFLSLFFVFISIASITRSQNCNFSEENLEFLIPVELIYEHHVFNENFRCVSVWTPNRFTRTDTSPGTAVFLIYQNLPDRSRISSVRFQTFYLGSFFGEPTYLKISETKFEITGGGYENSKCIDAIGDFASYKLSIDVTDVINNEIALVKLGDDEYKTRRKQSRTSKEVEGYNSHISISAEVISKYNYDTGEWDIPPWD
jgi:hypothetical protein